MKRVIFTLEGPEGRHDEIVFESGAVLQDLSSMKKHSPYVTVSQLLAVRLEDTEAAERAKAARARLTSYFPDDPRGHLLRLPTKGTDEDV